MPDQITEEQVTMGRRVASRRVLLGLSQRELAQALGLSQQTIGGIEADSRTPSVATLRLIANHLGVTETWLLRGDRAA